MSEWVSQFVAFSIFLDSMLVNYFNYLIGTVRNNWERVIESWHC